MAENQLRIKYPNLNNQELLHHYVGCVLETEQDGAMNCFRRTCFAEVEITEVAGFKRNCEPSCIWRVCYKIKDRTPDYCEKGSETNKPTYICPLPQGEEELKTLFLDITKVCGFIGLKVVGKQYSVNREIAVVDYSPIYCDCGVQDFNMGRRGTSPAAIISEVTMDLCNMQLG